MVALRVNFVVREKKNKHVSQREVMCSFEFKIKSNVMELPTSCGHPSRAESTPARQEDASSRPLRMTVDVLSPGEEQASCSKHQLLDS